MQWRIVGFVVVAVCLGAQATICRAEEPPEGAVPLPVERTTIVRAEDGPVYFVDGPTVIPPGAEITVQLDVQIVGINGASLDVQGGLKVHGTRGHAVTIRDVDLSPSREPRYGIHLDMVRFENSRLVHAEGEGFTGDLTIENALMLSDCAFQIRMRTGTLKLMSIESRIPWIIRCESPDPKTQKILLQVRSCLAGQVDLIGPCDATFRHCAIEGGLVCQGVTKVVVDGCDVSETLAFHQAKDEVFKGIKLTKCNLFWGCTLVLDREPNEDARKEGVRVDKFYFGPREGPGAVTKACDIQALIEDGEDVPHRRVKARVGKAAKRPHLLVDYEMLRRRDKTGGGRRR